MSAIIPIPRVPITVRPATPADLPFIDQLQKMHARQVGWMPTAQLEGKVRAGQVLIAEMRHEGTEARRHEGEEGPYGPPAFASVPTCLRASVPYSSSLGYVIAVDRYFKRDDVGIIYQMNVSPAKQRGLIGATLLKAQFERSAYGCRLYCCWCAQDIEANRFWESMGFVPLAFRAGSRDKGRVHIFWQRRILAGDTTTPYWFPAQTSSGSLREDRLVFPIPPGVQWSDEMPRILPERSGVEGPQGELPIEGPNRLPGTRLKQKAAPPPRLYDMSRTKLHFALPAPAKASTVKAPREKRPAVKNDPRLVAAARELRDRWLERVNAGDRSLPARGKYDVSRALTADRADRPAPVTLTVMSPTARVLPAA